MLKFNNISYDPDTGKFYRKGKEILCVDKDGYLNVNIKNKRNRGHRLAWFMYYGSWPVSSLDHINQNKLDNRISNLREVTHSENNRNIGIKTSNTSGIPGVIWDKKSEKWSVQIRTDLGRLYLGMYEDIELAELVIEEARIKYHKSFNGFDKNW